MNPLATLAAAAVLLAQQPPAAPAQQPPTAPTIGPQPTSPAVPAPAADPNRAATLFVQRCKDCHDPPTGEAPSREEIAKRMPDEVFATMKSGLMKPMAEGLTDDEMRALAAYVTAGAPVPAEGAKAMP